MKKIVITMVGVAIAVVVCVQMGVSAESYVTRKYKQAKEWTKKHKGEIAAGAAVVGTVAAGAAAYQLQQNQPTGYDDMPRVYKSSKGADSDFEIQSVPVDQNAVRQGEQFADQDARLDRASEQMDAVSRRWGSK